MATGRSTNHHMAVNLECSMEECFEGALRSGRDRPEALAAALRVLSDTTRRHHAKTTRRRDDDGSGSGAPQSLAAVAHGRDAGEMPSQNDSNDDVLAVWLREKYSRLLFLYGDEYARSILQHQLDLLDQYHNGDNAAGLRGMLLDVIPITLNRNQEEDEVDQTTVTTLVCHQLSRLADANSRYILPVLQCLAKVPAARRCCLDWAGDRALPCLSHDDDDFSAVAAYVLSLVRKTEEALSLLPIIRSKIKKISDDDPKLERAIRAITQPFLDSPGELLFQTYQKLLIRRADEELTLLDTVVLLANADRDGIKEWMLHLSLPLVKKAIAMNPATNQMWVIDAHLHSGHPCIAFLGRVYLQLPSSVKRELVVLVINHYKDHLSLIEPLLDIETDAILPLRGTFIHLLRTEPDDDRIEVLCRLVVKLDSTATTNFVLLKSLLFSTDSLDQRRGLCFARELFRCNGDALQPTVVGWVTKILFPPSRRPIEPKIALLCMDCLEHNDRRLTFSELQMLLANTGLVQGIDSYKRRANTILAFEKRPDATKGPEKHGIVFCVDFFLERHVDLRGPTTWRDCVQWVFRLVTAYLHQSGKKWRADSWLSAVVELSSLVLPGPTTSWKRRLEQVLNDFDSPMSSTEHNASLYGSFNVDELNHDQQLKAFFALSGYSLGVIVSAAVATTVLQSSLRQTNGARTLSSAQIEQLQRLLAMMAKARISFAILNDLSGSICRAKPQKRQRESPRSPEGGGKSTMTTEYVEQDSFAAVTASLSVLKRLREDVFMARSFLFLCGNALWSRLDTNILLGCIRKSCKQDGAVCSIDALVVQTQIYDHLTLGLIQGHISYTDLEESNVARSISMFSELFQILDELPMIERRESKDKNLCLLLERAVGSLMHLLKAVASCFQSKIWLVQPTAKTIAVSKILLIDADNANERELPSLFFPLLLQRIKLISSPELCECAMNLLVQLGLAAGGADTLKAIELSWASLQSSLERADAFKIEVADIVNDGDTLLPLRNIFDTLLFDVEDVQWLVGARKRPLACSTIIRHFARLSLVHSSDVWKSSANFRSFFACTDRLFRNDNIEGDIAVLEAFLLVCVITANHCSKSVPTGEQQLLLDVISLLGTLGRLVAKKAAVHPQLSESLVVRAAEAVLRSSIAVLDHTSLSSVSCRQTLLNHVAFEIVGTYSALLEACNSRKEPRSPRVLRMKKIERARKKALAVISDCVAATGLLSPDFARVKSPVADGADLPQITGDCISMSRREVDDMSIAASFTANWGEAIDPDSSEQSLVLETPTVVFQAM